MAQARTRSTSGYKAVTTLTVSIGLVNIPVRVLSSTDSKNGGRQFHRYHDHDDQGPGRVRQKQWCEVCETEIAFTDIIKGLEMPDRVLLFTKDELANLPLQSMRSLEVVQFAQMSEVSGMLFDTNYILEPDGPTSVTAYAVLMAAMAEKDRVGICKAALREGKEHLGALRIQDGNLILTTMRWPAEVRKPHFDSLDGVDVSPAMQKMAGQLVDSMTKKFDPEEFTDQWGAALEELIDAKASGKAIAAPAPSAPATSSLEDALMASLAASSDAPKSGKQKKKAS